jgi:Tfp pilus assembly protein PilV
MIEVLISVLLLSGSILGLVRVLGNSLQQSGDLEYRSVAATLADETLGRMWVDRANIYGYEVVAEDISERLPGGTRSIDVDTVAGSNLVTVTIRWQAPSAPGPSEHEVTARMATNGAPTAAPPPP